MSFHNWKIEKIEAIQAKDFFELINSCIFSVGLFFITKKKK